MPILKYIIDKIVGWAWGTITAPFKNWVKTKKVLVIILRVLAVLIILSVVAAIVIPVFLKGTR